MKINVHVKSRAKKEYVEKIGENTFIVSVKEPPVDGKANSAVVEAFSEYFKVPKNKVFIIAGHTSKQKVVEII